MKFLQRLSGSVVNGLKPLQLQTQYDYKFLEKYGSKYQENLWRHLNDTREEHLVSFVAKSLVVNIVNLNENKNKNYVVRGRARARVCVNTYV